VIDNFDLIVATLSERYEQSGEITVAAPDGPERVVISKEP
jgi:hypothetical protein